MGGGGRGPKGFGLDWRVAVQYWYTCGVPHAWTVGVRPPSTPDLCPSPTGLDSGGGALGRRARCFARLALGA